MPSNLREIQSSAFQGCDNLKKVTMNEKVTKIGQMAFRNCTKLESIVIPESVNVIGSAAFQYCNSLKTINIPKNVTMIKYGAFSGCSSLTEITVSDSNAKYKAENGVLFDKLENMLVSYPAGKAESSYSVPEGTSVVERLAFWEATNLTEITLPDSVRTLNIRSFAHCKMISEIHLPVSVTKIDDAAFEECRALKSCYVMNEHASFGTDVFKGVPEVELYGAIGSTAEQYAGMMRIAFHVVETGSVDEPEEVHKEETPADEDSGEEAPADEDPVDEDTEEASGNMTRWVLFFGIVLAACLLLLLAILMVRRIGGKDDSAQTGSIPGASSGSGTNIPGEESDTIAFQNREMQDIRTSWQPEDSEATWIPGRDNQPDDLEDPGKTWKTVVGDAFDRPDDYEEKTWGPVQGDAYDRADHRGDPYKTQVLGNGAPYDRPDDLRNPAMTSGLRWDNAGGGSDRRQGPIRVQKAQQSGGGIRMQGDPEVQSAIRKPQPGDLDGQGSAKSVGRCTCRTCGSLNDLTQKYCITCGAVLQEADRKTESGLKRKDTVVCPYCGMKIDGTDSVFCFNCGKRLR